MLALLLRGTCRYYPRPDGEERTTYCFLPGSYAGCLAGQPSQLSMQVLAKMEVVVFDYAVLRQRSNSCSLPATG